MHLRPGTSIAQNRYVVEAELGRGGIATVYRVRHAVLGTPLALKVLTEISEGQSRRLMREARAQASMRHSNVVSVVDVVDLDGRPGVVMEYVEGESLDQLLGRIRLSVGQTDALARGILAGVIEAHRLGFIHRDLKPANVLLTVEGRRIVPKVADFGLVKQTEGGDEATLGTRSGAIMGTPAYMAPEQIRDAATVDARADIFSLGVMFYEMACGKRPFAGSNSFELLEAIVYGRSEDPSVYAPELPERIRAAILAAMSAEPGDRPEDVSGLATAWLDGAQPLNEDKLWSDEILDAMRKGPTVPPPVTTLQPATDPSTSADPTSALAPRSHRRRLLLAMATGMTATAVACGCCWFDSLRQQAKHEQHVMHTTAVSGLEAGKLNSELTRLEGVLATLAASAADRLEEPPTDGPVFRAEDFDMALVTGAERVWPIDLEARPAYGGEELSLDHLVFVPSPSAEGIETATQLSPMRRDFRRAFLRSSSEQALGLAPDRAVELLGSAGVPLMRARIALEDGLYAEYPGHGGFAVHFDGRRMPFYDATLAGRGTTWTLTESGLATCATPIYDKANRPLGALELTVSLERLFPDILERMPATRREFMIASDGNVVHEAGRTSGASQPAPVALPMDQVRPVLAEGWETGFREIAVGETKWTLTFDLLHTTGWYYVTLSPAS